MKTKNNLKHAFKCDMRCGDFDEIMLLSDHVLSFHQGRIYELMTVGAFMYILHTFPFISGNNLVFIQQFSKNRGM